MPTLNSALGNANTHRHSAKKFESVWRKAAEVANAGERFCIDDIFQTREPDAYGRLYWVIRCITDTIDTETQRVYINLPRTPKRDVVMGALRDELNKLRADDDNEDTLFHGCFLELLPAQQKGYRDSIILKADDEMTLELNGCTCKYISGELDDHPF